MRYRSATPADLEALIGFPDTPGLRSPGRDQVRADFAAGRMRPEWSWVLEQDDRIVGRALWWGRGATTPIVLETLDLLPHLADPRALAVGLIRGGHARFALARPPDYLIRLPAGWREDEPTVQAVQWRREAAAKAGLTQSLERRQLAWTPSSPVPDASTRVTFRTGSDEEFLELFQGVAQGSLDVGTRRALAVTDPVQQAQEDFDFYLSCPGERDWWRVALGHDGTPVGFIVPSATSYNRNVGYLGVLPSHRGQGLIDDLLGGITRFQAASGADRITATTDLTNRPMAAAFARAGYETTEIRLILEAPR